MAPPPSLEKQNTAHAKPNRWYLAYGSNLSSNTFRGRRGIRPLDEVNVVVPSLELTFDLPGLPYWEPCFANVRLRWADEDQGVREKGDTTFNTSKDPGQGEGRRESARRVLMGVAYLVTPEDFVRIIATEGGGLSYEEKEVECWSVAKTDDKTAGGRRIIASTLIVPDSRRRLAPMQPSKRYIDIIRAGAREHDMPASYIAYLDSIPYYQITGLRQRIGAVSFLVAWFIPFMLVIVLSLLFGDRKTGHLPGWVAAIQASVTSTMWKTYLEFWKRIFGSGEVTEGSETLGFMEPNEKREAAGYEEHASEDSAGVVIAQISTIK